MTCPQQAQRGHRGLQGHRRMIVLGEDSRGLSPRRRARNKETLEWWCGTNATCGQSLERPKT